MDNDEIRLDGTEETFEEMIDRMSPAERQEAAQKLGLIYENGFFFEEIDID